jgi:lipoprotein-releasing system ATP-binding protein
MSEPVLRLQDIGRKFRQGTGELQILDHVELCLAAGELVALVGPSGSGKSTLLHLAGLLERPTSGEVFLDGRPCNPLGDAERTRLRRLRIGFVFQFHHLLGDFTALENVVIPQLLAGVGRRPAAQRARELLQLVGLSERLEHRPARLSGGEQQRVAIARALANRPALLLADEPTGNLDSETAETVFELLLGVVRQTGAAALIATHNPALAARMDRTLVLHDRRVSLKVD